MPRLNANFKSESEKKKYLYCDGSTFSASEYPKLALLIGTTLPDLRNRFLQGSDNGFNYLDAGLPNITGSFTGGSSGSYAHATGASGSFRQNGAGYDLLGAGPVTIYEAVKLFNASWSSEIYGKSDTVQPPALTVRYYIRAK